MHRIKDAFLDPDATELTVQTDPQKCSLGRWIYADSTVAMKDHDYQFQSLWVKLEQFHRDLHMTATSISDTLQHGAREEAIRFYRKQTQRAAKDSLATIDQILTWHGSQIEGMETAKAIYATETVPSLHKVQHLLKKIRETARAHIMTDEAMLQAAEATRRNVSVAGLTAVTIGTLLAFFIARGIVGVLRRISGQVDEGAEQVASASGQVSSASQSLAGGASEQAASLEETSSSLEKMASMTRQNADNANQANQFMDNTNRIVADASREMQDLDRSMGDISEASQETKKIVKTIDEIAFQTNLLALNAAVEAARAGEAGAGFAVVADEVRNLAMRAAEAAKTTSHLIDGTSQRVTDGATYVTRVGQAFDEISQSAGKVGELVAEIAAASSEQAQGVEQINRAVTEMSQVVQQNAATAEESAAASEEMNAQAEQMGHMVGGLIRLVDSANGNSLSTALRPGPAPCAKSASETSSVGSSPAESTPRPVIPQ